MFTSAYSVTDSGPDTSAYSAANATTDAATNTTTNAGSNATADLAGECVECRELGCEDLPT